MLVSRGLCHFELLATLPGGRSIQAVNAAELAARARTPFADPDFRFVWGDKNIGVWSWSKSSLGDAFGDEVSVVPETLLHQDADGVVLRQCMDGFEAQYWFKGQLSSSRWWPRKPTESQWGGFVRGVNEPAVKVGEATEIPRLRAQPPAAPNPLLDFTRRLRPRDFVAAAIVALAAPLAFYTGQWVHLDLSTRSVQGELAEVQQASEEVVSARISALAARANLQAYGAIISNAHPIEALAIFAESAEKYEATLQSFILRDGGLEIVIRANEPLSPAQLVEDLENDPLLAGVLLEPTNRSGEWRLFARFDEGERL